MLSIKNLTTEYDTGNDELKAVDDMSFTLKRGETLGIVGESGCGKSTLAKSILRLVDQNGQITGGEIDYKGTDLTSLSTKEMNNKLRWKEISFIPQNAMNALDPVFTVGSQMNEVVRTHTDMTRKEATEHSKSLLDQVGLEEGILQDYAHELSGGQQQRVVIALAIALNPDLIVADEITTGLDVVVQDDILGNIKELQDSKNASMLFISHDIHSVASISDRIIVMYGGQIIEIGETERVVMDSAHPYTMGLLNATPSIHESKNDSQLISIPGSPPDLTAPPKGCRFKDRCPFGTKECDEVPLLQEKRENHSDRCHHSDRRTEFQKRVSEPETWGVQ